MLPSILDPYKYSGGPHTNTGVNSKLTSTSNFLASFMPHPSLHLRFGGPLTDTVCSTYLLTYLKLTIYTKHKRSSRSSSSSSSL